MKLVLDLILKASFMLSFFLGTLLICFIRSVYFALAALRHIILDLGRNLTFFARNLWVSLIFYCEIYLNPRFRYLVVDKTKKQTKKLPEVKLLLPISAFHINQLNEDYTYLSSLLSRKHHLRRCECECSPLELCSAQDFPSSVPTPILCQ